MAVDTDLRARAQWLRSRIALAEYLGVVPSTQTGNSQLPVIAAHGDLTPPASTGHQHSLAHVDTQHIYDGNNVNLLKNAIQGW